MGTRKCLVCGRGEDDVDKLHYFPRNLERSRRWQEAMHMVFSGESLRNHTICNLHFSPDSYKEGTLVLQQNAVPTLLPGYFAEPASVLPTHTSFDDSAPLSPIMHSSRSVEILSPSMEKTSGPSTSNFPSHSMPFDDSIPSTSTSSPTTMQSSPSVELFSSTKKTSRPSITVKKRRSLFKDIPITMGSATHREKLLMNVIRKKEDHLRKVKKECKRRGKSVKNICKLDESVIIKNLMKDMPSRTADFLIGQLRCAKRVPKGRRWTLDEKIVALALHKRSPKCYGLLRKFIALPSRRTLTAMLEKIPFEAGMNVHLFQHVNNRLSLCKEEDRLCIISFDEMDIKQFIEYDRVADCIRGYEDLGQDKASRMLYANKALVFMAQGLRRKWKQPLAFYFVSGSCPVEVLQQLILDVINAAKNIAKLKVVATVCDMGTNNVSALKRLKNSMAQSYFMHEETKIYTIFDPPHLLKCTAALFRKYKMTLPVEISEESCVMEAAFEDVVNAYKVDQETPLIFRSMHKLKEVHLAPIMRSAMKVKIAAQLMSRTVAAFIFSLVSRGVLPQSAVATATFIHQVDELFDSFNGNSKTAPDGKELRCWMSDDTPHLEYWAKAYKTLEQWNFVRKTALGNVREARPPSHLGWLTSIKAIQGIWQATRGPNFSYLRPRSLNQDSLENLFGAIRSGCGCSDNPTVPQFISSLKTQVINGLANSNLESTNCELDDGLLLTDLRLFIDSPQMDTEHVATSELEEQQLGDTEDVANDIVEAVKTGNAATFSVAYVAGYIVGRLLKDLACETCYTVLTAEDDLLCNQFIEFKDLPDKRKLLRPSEMFVITVGQCITKLEHFLCTLSSNNNVEKRAKDAMMAISFSWISCSTHEIHIKEAVLTGVCRIGIPWFCKRKNQENKASRTNIRATKRKLKKLKNL